MKGVAILVGLWRDRWSADASTVFDEQRTSADFVSGRNSAIACFFVVVVFGLPCYVVSVRVTGQSGTWSTIVEDSQ